MWEMPESVLRVFDDLAPGADVIELGCGTGAVTAWLARNGMRPVGVDFSRRQLETIELLQDEFRLSFPAVLANAEDVPYDRSSFDLVLSEYGPSVWCDPGRWLAEASRVLRRHGRLVFFTSGAMLITCTPASGDVAEERLARDYFNRHRLEFPGQDTVEFHLSHGNWVRALRDAGFILEDLIEVRPPVGAKPRLEFASVEWARRWPSEEVWIARKINS